MKTVYIDERVRVVEILLFDGAMGTMLQKKGLSFENGVEGFNITKKDIIYDIHKEYIDAGANIITTNTFGANELKLKGYDYTVEEVIDSAISIAKKAVRDKGVKVALDIGPIGQLLEPIGTLSFDRAYEIFKRQVVQGVKSGADIILIETMTDLYEAKAAVLAAKENSTLPVFCTMSFEKNQRTFTGCTPESMVITLEGLGVDAIGINCSLGPREIKPILSKILKVANKKVMVQPNAGLPKMDGEKVLYDVNEDEFSTYMMEFLDLGVDILGGCCGTTPSFIEAVKEKVKDKKIKEKQRKEIFAVCTHSKVVNIDGVKIIGERINPTGKKIFKEALKNNDLNYILKQAIEQVEAGADILDVNVGIPNINEEEVMVEVIRSIQEILDIPLQIDSTDKNVIEKALRYYNGKAIVNSVNGEDKVLDTILPIVKKYGAAVVGLTLDERGIPNSAEERFRIAKKIVDKAKKYGIDKENIFIDCLVLTASTQQKEVFETLKSITMVKERLGVKTLLGVSNISFGLPNRSLINETFLSLALGRGLDLPIINPNSKGMIDVIKAFNVLSNYDKDSREFIEYYKANENKDNKQTIIIEESAKDLKYMIIKGLKEDAKEETRRLLKVKKELEIVNEYLIPALDEVGFSFEKGEIFLPQLVSSAEVVQKSFEVLKENLSKSDKEKINNGKIILATVKGDIHDIGKNIVKVILENYGYEVIDLGKDVPIEKVINALKKHEAKLVGLSALMTTTLKSMEETIKTIRESNIDTKVFVGGAVLTKEYAKDIGADFYAKDAKESVEIAKRVLKNIY
ncbi:MAG: homocysteine S-methyltransferase family protein [Clostridium perfringens]|nr:homocysteine S-methyltransferase family protein [Clostridium perfringens]